MARATTTTKKCTRCQKWRKVETFHKDRHQKDGLSSWCKPCTASYDREYRARKKAEPAATTRAKARTNGRRKQAKVSA